MSPNDNWLKVLADHGVSVLIVLFLLFVALPAGWVAVRKVVGWFGVRFDKIIDGHMTFLSTSTATLQQSVETSADIKDLIMKAGVSDSQFSLHATEQLGDIHEGVQGLHHKVDRILEHKKQP